MEALRKKKTQDEIQFTTKIHSRGSIMGYFINTQAPKDIIERVYKMEMSLLYNILLFILKKI